jgi:hypothetical protein
MRRRALAIALLAAGLLLGFASSTWAHHGSEDNPQGLLDVPARAHAALAVDDCKPGDTLQWTWTVSGAEPPQVSTQLVWRDTAGREHPLEAEPAGQMFGTFVAPAGFAGGRLVWRNASDRPAVVRWSYGASVSFWRSPSVFLPAMIPVFLLLICLVIGAIVDTRRRHGRRLVTAGRH